MPASPFAVLLTASLLLCGTAGTLAYADKIKHPRAMFTGLDKITGRIFPFEVAIDETLQFGTLQITPRVCYTRPPTEAPQTTSFIEVQQADANNTYKKIFSGWVFASSPGLNGIEHPVYDIWLNDCKGGTEIIPSPPENANQDEPAPDLAADNKQKSGKPKKPASDPNLLPPEVAPTPDVGGLTPTNSTPDQSNAAAAPPAPRQPVRRQSPREGVF